MKRNNRNTGPSWQIVPDKFKPVNRTASYSGFILIRKTHIHSREKTRGEGETMVTVGGAEVTTAGLK